MINQSAEKLNRLFHSVAAFREFGRHIIVQEFVIYKQRMHISVTLRLSLASASEH